MPIEFSCPQCSRVLRVSDEHAGKTARCPDCQMVMNIPVPEVPTFGQPDYGQIESPVPPAPGHAPYPHTPPPGFKPGGTGFPHQPSAAPQKQSGAVQPTAVAFDEIFSYAWRAFSANIGLLVGVTLVVLGVAFGIGIAQTIVEGPRMNPPPERVLLGMLIGLFGNLISIFLSIGQVRVNYDIARHGRASFATLFSGGDKFLPVLGASIVAGIATAAGFVLLIVPGLILITLFWSFFHFIADNKTSAMGSFSAALEVGKRNVGTTIVLALMSILLAIAGVLALFVGTLFTTPLISMMWCVAYLKMTRQI